MKNIHTFLSEEVKALLQDFQPERYRVIQPWLDLKLAAQIQLEADQDCLIALSERCQQVVNASPEDVFWLDVFALYCARQPDLCELQAPASSQLLLIHSKFKALTPESAPFHEAQLKTILAKQNRFHRKNGKGHSFSDLLLLNRPATMHWLCHQSRVCAIDQMHLTYAFWTQLGIIQRSSETRFEQHLLMHLSAMALKAYATVEMDRPDQRYLYRPLLVLLLRRLAEISIDKVCYLRNYLSDLLHLLGPVAYAEGYTLLKLIFDDRLNQLKNNDESQRKRDELMAGLYQSDRLDLTIASQNTILANEIAKQINTFLKNEKLTPVLFVDGFVHNFQDKVLNYTHVNKQLHGTDAGENGQNDGSPGLDRFVYWKNQKHLVHSKRKNLAYDVYQHYQREVAHFWGGNVPAQHFNRMGFARKFEALWYPHGDILLFYLLESLIALKPEADLLAYLNIQNIWSELSQFHNYHALIDSMERYLCPFRMTNKITTEDPSLRKLNYLIWHLYPGPGIDQTLAEAEGQETMPHPGPKIQAEQMQRLLDRATLIHQRRWLDSALIPDFCCDSDLTWLEQLTPAFFRSICPYPSYRFEFQLRRANSVPLHSFNLPMSLETPGNLDSEQIQAAPPIIPASFLSGMIADKGLCLADRPDARSVYLPYVSAHWRHVLLPVAHLIRHIIDFYLLQSRQEEARRTLKVKAFGVLNAHVLEQIFSKDALLGLVNKSGDQQEVGREILGVHRSDELIAPEDLAYYLSYAAGGDFNFIPDSSRKDRLVNYLYHHWQDYTQSKKHQFQRKNELSDQDLANVLFFWFKSNTYDLMNSNKGAAEISVAQVFQFIWQTQRQLQKQKEQHHRDIDINPSLQIRGSSHSMDTFTSPDFRPAQLFKKLSNPEEMKRITGNSDSVLGCPNDTRQIRFKAKLAGPFTPLDFLTELSELIFTHLRAGVANQVSLTKLDVRYQFEAAEVLGSGRLSWLLFCDHAFTDLERQTILDPDRQGNFRKTLNCLCRSLNPALATPTFKTLGHFVHPIEPGVSIFTLTDSPECAQTLIVLTNAPARIERTKDEILLF